MENEWQERPKGQTSDYALAVGWLLLGLLDLVLLVPGRSGYLQAVTACAGVVALLLSAQSFRRGRALNE